MSKLPNQDGVPYRAIRVARRRDGKGEPFRCVFLDGLCYPLGKPLQLGQVKTTGLVDEHPQKAAPERRKGGRGPAPGTTSDAVAKRHAQWAKLRKRHSVAEIAARFNMSEAAVYYGLKRHELRVDAAPATRIG